MSNLSEQQFNKDVFKTLASPIEEGGEGYLQGQLSDSAEYSRYAWSHTYLTMDAPHPWPRHFLKEATSDTNWSGEYREAVHLVLQKSGAVKNGMVTVRRTGKPRPGTINNVSIIPGWKGGGSLRPRATYEWEVPLHDVVGVGKEAEGEIFVHHPPDRAIRKVEDPVRRGE